MGAARRAGVNQATEVTSGGGRARVEWDTERVTRRRGAECAELAARNFRTSDRQRSRLASQATATASDSDSNADSNAENRSVNVKRMSIEAGGDCCREECESDIH